MRPFTDPRLSQRAGRGWLTATWLLIFSLLSVGAVWHSTIKPETTPTGGQAGYVQIWRQGSIDPSQGPIAQTGVFSPYLHIIPSLDGTEIFVSAGTAEVGGTVFVNIGIGPGHEKGGWTMTYSDTDRAYVATVTGFTPGLDDYAPLSITSTLGLDTGYVEFTRAHVQASTPRSIFSEDGYLELELINPDTFPHNTYIALVPSYGLPGPLPDGYRLVGRPYDVRAAGAQAETERPMILRLRYDDITLDGADPHSLSILAWDAFNRRWDNLGGTLHTSPRRYVSVATSRFANYALVDTNTWRDEFFDSSGLDSSSLDNVTSGGPLENPTLILTSAPGRGSAVSQIVSPTTAISNWDTLIYTGTAGPPDTTLSVDVLAADGTELLIDLASGTSLVDLVDATQYPRLRLRVTMNSAIEGQTPSLDAWQLSWWAERSKVYLPLMLKGFAYQSSPQPHDIVIRVDPPAPTQADVIEITPSGWWNNGCTPQYRSHQVVGNVVRIDAVANPNDMACPMVVTDWKFTVEVGILPTGVYDIQLYIATGSRGWPVLYGTRSLTVSP